MLDFVPNHLAVDHPWISSYPGRFIEGRDADIQRHAEWYFSQENIKFAHGRDPNFPPWTDTVQVNFWSEELREALINELLGIAEICEGVRCDMTMLALNKIFKQVWGDVVGDMEPPEKEFWQEAINRVKKTNPGFIFQGEVYWGLERELQEMGFEFTYDKSLYDLLLHSSPESIKGHLTADYHYHEHSARFIENHDESRALTAFGCERSLAAAAIFATLPGLHLFYDGQLEGKQIRVPLQLRREPLETPNPSIHRFYEILLNICNAQVFHEGRWNLVETEQASNGDNTFCNILAWTWHYKEHYRLVVVNYAASLAKGRIHIKTPIEHGQTITCIDELSGIEYEQDPDDILARGLELELNPWQSQIIQISHGR